MSILGNSRELILPASALLAVILSACGGGNSGTPDSIPVSQTNAATYQVAGIVAYGHPVAGKSVLVHDSSGRACGAATTASDGSYSLSTALCAAGSAVFSVLDFTT